MNNLAQHFRAILDSTGEDMTRPGLKDTPQRAAKAFQYLTNGNNQDLKTIVNNALFESKNNDLVMVHNIEFFSLCEHHILPFYGKCHIAYLPENKVLGLSKFGRIVDMFAHRLQIQEKLTLQIAQAISQTTTSPNVAVYINAQHMCMMMRGVQKAQSSMQSYSLLGKYQTDPIEKRYITQLLAN